MILIYGIYALIHWTGEIQDIEEMTVTQLSYDEVPESVQTSIDEMVDRNEDFRYQGINRRSVIKKLHDTFGKTAANHIMIIIISFYIMHSRIIHSRSE